MSDEENDHQKTTLREGMEKQLHFLQDIPPSQRTQRHSMQIEYFILSDKCSKIAKMTSHAREPLHVNAAKLGDPVAFHAMLARMFFCCQVGLLCIPHQAQQLGIDERGFEGWWRSCQ